MKQYLSTIVDFMKEKKSSLLNYIYYERSPLINWTTSFSELETSIVLKEFKCYNTSIHLGIQSLQMCY